MPHRPVVRARGSAFAVVWLAVITLMLGALACAALRPCPTSYIEWTRVADATRSPPGRHVDGQPIDQGEGAPAGQRLERTTGNDDESVLARFEPPDLALRLAEVLALDRSTTAVWKPRSSDLVRSPLP